MVVDTTRFPLLRRLRAGTLVLVIASIFLGSATTEARAPTEYEQYLIELINRARADPEAEAARVGIDLNEGLPAGFIAADAVQPLAINPLVTDAAFDYTQTLIDNDDLGHDVGGTTLSSRLSDAGYTLLPTPAGANESYGAQVDNSTVSITQSTVEDQYLDWFINSSVSFRLDRITMFYDNVEIGLGLNTDDDFTFYGPSDPFAMVSVVKYTYRNEDFFITGVAYNDLDNDNFYTPGTGEALGGVPIQVYNSATDAFVTSGMTFASGGYSLQLPDGTYDIVFDAPAGPVTYSDIQLAGSNVKLDLTAVPEPGTGLWLIAALVGFSGRRRRRSSERKAS